MAWYVFLCSILNHDEVDDALLELSCSPKKKRLNTFYIINYWENKIHCSESFDIQTNITASLHVNSFSTLLVLRVSGKFFVLHFKCSESFGQKRIPFSIVFYRKSYEWKWSVKESDYNPKRSRLEFDSIHCGPCF